MKPGSYLIALAVAALAVLAVLAALAATFEAEAPKSPQTKSSQPIPASDLVPMFLPTSRICFTTCHNRKLLKIKKRRRTYLLVDLMPINVQKAFNYNPSKIHNFDLKLHAVCEWFEGLLSQTCSSFIVHLHYKTSSTLVSKA